MASEPKRVLCSTLEEKIYEVAPNIGCAVCFVPAARRYWVEKTSVIRVRFHNLSLRNPVYVPGLHRINGNIS